METKERFAGDKKEGASILSRPEKWLVRKLVPMVPQRVETYHLTMMTVLWSALVLVFAFLARTNLIWLTGVSVMIALQYLTDLLDGAVGRGRNTGLIKWGYYMDHFLDYIFNSCMVIGFALIAPAGMLPYFLFLVVLTGGFLVNSYLTFAATNKFEIYFYGFGPTEARIAIIALNTLLIRTGVEHFRYTVPIACVVSLIGLVFLVHRSHRMLWKIDMETKADSASQESPEEASSNAVSCQAG